MITTNRLKAIRVQRGIPAARLAEQVEISRQTIYAIEDGSYVPNTSIALRLAQVLAVSVEDLFLLESQTPLTAATYGSLVPGESVKLVRTRDQTLAVPASSAFAFLPPITGAVTSVSPETVEVQSSSLEPHDAILLAGCDPALSILTAAAHLAGIHVCLLPVSSRRAVSLLRDGKVQIAGSHLFDPATQQFNLSFVRKSFANDAVRIVTFAVWQTGLIMRPDSAPRIRSISDLASPGIRFVNREKGSGSRTQFDLALAKAGLHPTQVQGYETTANGHLAAARAVAEGWADSCFAVESAARCYGLHFLAVATERFDLVLPEHFCQSREGQVVLNLLSSAEVRNKLASLAGYETSQSGRQVA